MQTHQIHVLGARERVQDIRTELFDFPEVLDVFITGRPDALVVVYAGRPRPGEWLRALRGLGYRTAARGHAPWPRIEQRFERRVTRAVKRVAAASPATRHSTHRPSPESVDELGCASAHEFSSLS